MDFSTSKTSPRRYQKKYASTIYRKLTSPLDKKMPSRESHDDAPPRVVPRVPRPTRKSGWSIEFAPGAGGGKCDRYVTGKTARTVEPSRPTRLHMKTSAYLLLLALVAAVTSPPSKHW